MNDACLPGATALERDIAIVNKRGLHARASAKFVQLVSGYNARVEVEKEGLRVDGGSILDLMMLAAAPGSAIRVIASGPEAADVMAAIEMLIAERFGEEA